MFRREWRQQILVIALLTVAVAAAIGSVTIAYNSGSADDAEFGSASYLLRFDGTDPRALEAGLDSARKWFGTTEVIGYRSFAVPGSVDTVEFRAQDPRGAFGSALLALRRGRYPVGPRQVAVTDGVADLLALELGETLALDGRRRTVVGIVENPRRSDATSSPSSPRHPQVRPTPSRFWSMPMPARSTATARPAGRAWVGSARRGNDQAAPRPGDVLRGHRLPAPGLAGRRRWLHRDCAAATPPARHARRDRCDAEAPATRAADQRRRRRRDRRRRSGRSWASRSGSGSCRRSRPGSTTASTRSACPGRCLRWSSSSQSSAPSPPPGGPGGRSPASPSRSPSPRGHPGRSRHIARRSWPPC